jgi:hypothetical protein
VSDSNIQVKTQSTGANTDKVILWSNAVDLETQKINCTGGDATFKNTQSGRNITLDTFGVSSLIQFKAGGISSRTHDDVLYKTESCDGTDTLIATAISNANYTIRTTGTTDRIVLDSSDVEIAQGEIRFPDGADVNIISDHFNCQMSITCGTSASAGSKLKTFSVESFAYNHVGGLHWQSKNTAGAGNFKVGGFTSSRISSEGPLKIGPDSAGEQLTLSVTGTSNILLDTTTAASGVVIKTGTLTNQFHDGTVWRTEYSDGGITNIDYIATDNVFFDQPVGGFYHWAGVNGNLQLDTSIADVDLRSDTGDLTLSSDSESIALPGGILELRQPYSNYIRTTVADGNINIETTGSVAASDRIILSGSKVEVGKTGGKVATYGVTAVSRATTSTADVTAFDAGTTGATLRRNSTFDGYKIEQIVTALRLIGILS